MNRTGVSMSRIIRVKRDRGKYDTCLNCCYYHSGKDEGLEYCSMNRKRLFPKECTKYNRKIDGMVLYRQKKNRKKKGKNKNRRKTL
ncbi:hypothetical protein [Clostridium tyrobutyricum]|uniref:hypothetical protein n=1 Tax=Clostridium tyrobutyricum TaxID=1519 RepID=UPI00057CD304|nr:hypothetical protein [Clostridium tyrobutyricum]